jgi:hypothetical protein
MADEATGRSAASSTNDIRLLASQVGDDWVQLETTGSDTSDRTRAVLVRCFTDLLQSPTLGVLCGLGTSLYIRTPAPAPTMEALWDAATRLPDFEAARSSCAYPASAGTDLELLLSRCEMAAELDPLSPCEAFRQMAESMIVERCSFVTKDTKLDHHQAFLRRAVRRSGRLGRAQVFTTNYDEAFEYAAASIGYVVIDGFSYTVPRHFDPNYFDYDFVRRSHDGSPADYVPEVFYLHKLHGSVNWDASSSPIVQTTRPTRPLLVFPRQSKYELSYQRPFLDSMGRYQTMLRQPNLGLLIIGFGFHDKHLVEPVLSALRSNASLRLVVVDPSLPQSSNSSVAALRAVVQSGDSRVTLVAAQFEDLQVLIPDIAPASDAERREQQLREILEP